MIEFEDYDMLTLKASQKNYESLSMEMRRRFYDFFTEIRCLR